MFALAYDIIATFYFDTHPFFLICNPMYKLPPNTPSP